VLTRESLSEFTSAVAMSRCDDKRATRRIMARAGVRIPKGALATDGDLAAACALLEECGELVVKPARGEQGAGITVGVRDAAGLERAVARALQFCPEVLVEELVDGDDLRVVVIDHEVVAAAVRRPAEVVGDGRGTVRRLIEETSRRRERATDGESRIPLDETTEDVVAAAGHGMDDVLPAGERLRVRRTANLHTGGTIEDVTARLHPAIAEAAVRASRAIGIPVTGLDFLVPDVEGPDAVFVEANERPGLANHEPQPVVARFVDLLFPETRRR
jgi:GNAT-family acetyltransferase (TIGR03103 family)